MPTLTATVPRDTNNDGISDGLATLLGMGVTAVSDCNLRLYGGTGHLCSTLEGALTTRGKSRLVADSDQDGLSNLVELAHGTNPQAADTDGECVCIFCTIDVLCNACMLDMPTHH